MRGPIQRTPPRRGSPEGARPEHQTTEADTKRSDGRHRRQTNRRQTPAPRKQSAGTGATQTVDRHRRHTNSRQTPAAKVSNRRLSGDFQESKNRGSEFRPITPFCYRSKIYHGNKTGHFRGPVQKTEKKSRLVDVSIYIIHTCRSAAPGLTLPKKHFDRQATVWAGS